MGSPQTRPPRRWVRLDAKCMSQARHSLDIQGRRYTRHDLSNNSSYHASVNLHEADRLASMICSSVMSLMSLIGVIKKLPPIHCMLFALSQNLCSLCHIGNRYLDVHGLILLVHIADCRLRNYQSFCSLHILCKPRLVRYLGVLDNSRLLLIRS